MPDQVTKALREAGPAGGAAGMFSEDGLKNMIAESSLALPKDDLTKGRSWTRQTKVPTPPVGAMTLDKTYTYEGPDPQAGPNLDKVTLDTKIGIELAPVANSDPKIKAPQDQVAGGQGDLPL